MKNNSYSKDILQKELKNKHSEIDLEYVSKSVEDTKKLAVELARNLQIGDIIVLNGELGAGKTVFVTNIAEYFDILSQVSSPTFTIVNEYNLLDSRKIYHFDVYRISDSEEFEDTIGTDYFSNGICIIEWGNIIKDILPKNTLYIDITKDNNEIDTRYFKIRRDQT